MQRFGIKLVFYKDIRDEKLDLPEPSEILAENAYEKAKAAAREMNMYALGDDSGLYVHCLDGFPGVHSRRWTGNETDDHLRCLKIIGYVRDEHDKDATLISRFSLVSPDGKEVFKTVVRNKFEIADKIYGDKGFGYDSILIPYAENVLKASSDNFIKIDRAAFIIAHKLTIAELSQYEKNCINNRGRIATELSEYLKWNTIE